MKIIYNTTGYAIMVIRKYIDTYADRIVAKKGYPNYQKIYSKWAASELIDDLADNPDIPPVETIEKFRKKMDEYACLSEDVGYIFSIAYDTTTTILDMLL